MRILVLVIVCLSLCIPSLASITHNQDCTTGAQSGGNLPVTCSSTPVGGFIACVTNWDSTGTFTSLTDNATGSSNTYTQDSTATINGGNTVQRIFHVENDKGGVTTITLALTAGAHQLIQCTNFTGMLTASALDQHPAVNATFNQNWTSNASSTLSQANEVVIGQSFCPSATNCTYAAGSGYTALTTNSGHFGNSGNGTDSFMEWQIVASASAVTATGTVAGGDTANGAVFTYKGATVTLPANQFPRIIQ